VLHGSSLVRQAFQQALTAVSPKVAVSFDEVRPVLGALAVAVAGEASTPKVTS